MRWALALFLIAISSSQMLAAAPDKKEYFDVREFTCPIGEKTFKQDVGYAAFQLITMPDGSWLGDTEIGVQIPICPDNGLVLVPDLALSAATEDDDILYTNYSLKELEQLPALIADPTYFALKEDGPYAQAYWLATKLGRPAVDRLFMLQRSTWATRDPVKRKRLVQRFADEGPAIIDAMKADDEKKHYAMIVIVNALREVGRFDEALTLLDRIKASGTLVLGPPDPESIYEPEEAGEPLRLAIAQKDDGRFAAEMLPKRVLNDICDGGWAFMYGPTAPATKAACKIRRDREKKEEDDFEKALVLGENAPALDRKCAATPEDKQDGALKIACQYAQNDRDEAAGVLLTLDSPKLASDCHASTHATRKGPLFYACIKYNILLGSELGELLSDDPAGVAVICPGDKGAEIEDRADFASHACGDAERKLEDQDEEQKKAKLYADLPKLDAECAKLSDGDIYEEIGGVWGICSDRKDEKDTELIEQLSKDPKLFESACARFGKINSGGNDLERNEEQDICMRAYRLRENTRVQTEAEAKGLKCYADVIYSPDRPQCVSQAEYDREIASSKDDPKMKDIGWLAEDNPLRMEARKRAAAIIETAKAEGSYPKRKPGDL